MNARRKRLESVLRPLVQLNDFSCEEAKRHCHEAAPAYVTRTLGQLVRDGVLSCREVAHQVRYRWMQNANGEFEVDAWIQRQVCGTQISQTAFDERPRERLLRKGPVELTISELLAILIRDGVPGETAIIGGKRLANRYVGHVDALASASATDLRAISPAVTTASYCQIAAGIELGRRVVQAESRRRTAARAITSTGDAVKYCQNVFARLANEAVQEEFHIITLDTKHKPMATHRITIGTLDASLVHPREVFRPAIRQSASAIILVHNHPSGDPTPSREDRQVTQQMTQAGQLLGIQVLDHIVVARHGCLSVREHT